MPTESDKHDALVDFVDSTLSAVKAGPNVESRFRAGRTGQKSERDGLMGDPVYYAEVQREGYRAGESDERKPAGVSYTVEHEYGIRLWHDYEDTQVSKDTWDSLVEGSQGLVKELREKGTINYNGDTYIPKQPQEVQEAVTRLSSRGGNPIDDLAWYLELSIHVAHNI